MVSPAAIVPRLTTRVEIERRGWERLGAKGQRWRDADQAGWDGVLPAYVAACAAAKEASRS
jgi:hypothetical protein